MRKNLISIIIPTLNSMSHLKTLLPALEKQRYQNFEVIINDDKGTTDNTKGFIKQFSKKFKIKYMMDNIVTAHGRKMGAAAGRGEYILHLDADMKPSKKMLEDCMLTIEKNLCDALIIPEVSYGIGFWSEVKCFERSMYIGDESIECPRFFKTSVYWAVGGNNEKMTFGEDKDFELRVRAAGYKVCRVKEPVYHNEGNLTLIRDLKKKFYYGVTANVLFSTHPEYFLLYSNTIFRPAFFRNWKKLLKHPFLGLSMFFLKFLESVAGLVGLISYRIRFVKIDKAKWR